MSQCFKTLAALPEGPGLSPSTKQLSVSLVPGGLMISWPPWAPATHKVHRDIYVSKTPICNK